MAVITISRQNGCSGGEVARDVAERLGYHLIDKAVIGKILAGYGLIDAARVYESEASFWSSYYSNLQSIVSMMNRLVLAVARHGHTVLLGRGCYAALVGKPGVLNVRLHAPLAWRVAKIMVEKGIRDHGKAEAEVRESDKMRSTFVSSVYGLRWDAMESFDLAFNMSKIGSSMAAAWIAEAAKGMTEVEGARAEFGPEDSVLDDALESEIGCKR
jgi:CMP/dCMP kinase